MCQHGCRPASCGWAVVRLGGCPIVRLSPTRASRAAVERRSEAYTREYRLAGISLPFIPTGRGKVENDTGWSVPTPSTETESPRFACAATRSRGENRLAGINSPCVPTSREETESNTYGPVPTPSAGANALISATFTPVFAVVSAHFACVATRSHGRYRLAGISSPFVPTSREETENDTDPPV